ncbi:MAG: hypothetical protein ACLFSB_15075 [Chitinispirillaceae bacterium]
MPEVFSRVSIVSQRRCLPFAFLSGASTRELGRRYAKAFLSLADNDWVPRKGSVKTIENRPVAHGLHANGKRETVTIYTVDGRAINSVPANSISQATSQIRSNGVYIISRRLHDGTRSVVRFYKN